MSDSGAGAGRREVAWRLFAAEYDDAWYSYSQSDEERAPNYVVTPTGARVNRLFVVGVLTEVEPVSDEVLRARVVDPTGPFVIYAGQYQPEPLAFLERAEPPMFVAVTGKARTFQPEDADVVYTSVRPETVSEVDAETRDRWVVATAEQTLDRVSHFADALDRVERGDDLEDALLADGVDIGQAAGIPRAIEQYGTTPAYLDALRETALDAVRLVAGESDEVAALDLAPDEGGDVDLDATFSIGADGVSVVSDEGGGTMEPTGDATSESPATGETVADGTGDDDEGDAEDETADQSEITDAADAAAAEAEADAEDAEPEPTVEPERELGDEEGAEPAADAELGTGGAGDEMYEMDEEERQRVEEEHGLEFSTGTEVESPDETPESGGAADADPDVAEDAEPGEGDVEVTEEAVEAEDAEPPADEDQADALEGAGDDEPVADTGGDAAVEETASDEELEAAIDEAGPQDEADESDDEEAAAAEADGDEEMAATGEPADLDADELEDAVVESMQDLDDGDGAEVDELVATVVEEYGVAEDEVRGAIQDALMAGRCFEPDDAHVKPI